jgi:hypothetical protein
VEKRFLLQKAFDNRVTRPYNPAPRRRRVLRNTATGGVIRLDGFGTAVLVQALRFDIVVYREGE